jgi:hypothetical protein
MITHTVSQNICSIYNIHNYPVHATMKQTENRPSAKYDFTEIAKEIDQASMALLRALYAHNFQQQAKPFEAELDGRPIVVMTRIAGTGRRYNNLRDSIDYRCWAIQFHLHAIRQVHDDLLAEAAAIDVVRWFKDKNLPLYIHEKYALRERFLLDDVLLNTASLFDYLANLVCYVLIGEHSPNVRWQKFVRMCRSPKDHQALAGTMVAPTVIETHSRFINGLYNLRSDIAHHSILDTRLSSAINLMQDEMPDFKIRVNKDAVRRLLFLDKQYDWTDIELHKLAQYVALQTFVQANTILDKLLLDTMAHNRAEQLSNYCVLPKPTQNDPRPEQHE